MLTTMMTKEVVATREAFGVGASRDMTVKGDLSCGLLHVLTLMTNEVLRVEEPLTARASVRPLTTAKMYLEMAAEIGQCEFEYAVHGNSLQFAVAIERLVATLHVTSETVLTGRLSPLRSAL